MKKLLIALLSLSLRPVAGAAEVPVKTKTPAADVAALVRFAAPKGWAASDYANSGGADPVVRYEKDSDAITLKAYGGEGSAFPTQEAFLAGPAATSQGAAPKEEGTVVVAGAKRTQYRRKFPVNVPDPHGPPAPLMLGSERFVIVPVGKRFVVISSVHESAVPDMERSGEKAWAALLKTVKPAKAKR